jgi:hypothetical protein
MKEDESFEEMDEIYYELLTIGETVHYYLCKFVLRISAFVWIIPYGIYKANKKRNRKHNKNYNKNE